MPLQEEKKKKKNAEWHTHFDPDKSTFLIENLFGLPCNYENSQLVIIPVPWDITSTTMDSADTPELLLHSSYTFPLFSEEYEWIWKKGIFMQNIPVKWKETSHELKKIRKKIMLNGFLKLTKPKQLELLRDIKSINFTCKLLNEWIERKTTEHLFNAKTVALLGGDQGYIYGCLNTLNKKQQPFGIFSINALSGLENEKHQLEFTTHSALFNALNLSSVTRIVLFGTKYLSFRAKKVIDSNAKKIRLFSANYLDERKLKGATWKMLVNEALSCLPQNVFVSINANVFDPSVCSNSSCNEPGGLTFAEVKSILFELRKTSKNIIGFDISGLSIQSDTDKQFGLRLLYESCCSTLITNELMKIANLAQNKKRKVKVKVNEGKDN